MKKKFLKYFTQITMLTAQLSTCASKKVGCLLIKNNRILAISYNGALKGARHCEDIWRGKFNREAHHIWALKYEVHAEQNIISYCACNNIQTDEASLFMSLSCCSQCAKLIIAAGIKEVYYIEKYDMDKDGLKLLKKHKIKVVRI